MVVKPGKAGSQRTEEHLCRSPRLGKQRAQYANAPFAESHHWPNVYIHSAGLRRSRGCLPQARSKAENHEQRNNLSLKITGKAEVEAPDRQNPNSQFWGQKARVTQLRVRRQEEVSHRGSPRAYGILQWWWWGQGSGVLAGMWYGRTHLLCP